MIKLKLKHCKLAEKEHKESKRQYAHVFHYHGSGYGDRWSDFVICFAKNFNILYEGHQYGILAHEIGHIIAGENSDEITADITVKKVLGVRIRYVNSEYGDNLQFLNKGDVKLMKQAIKFMNDQR